MRTVRLIQLSAILGASLGMAQTADGYIRIGSDRRELHFAHAARVVDDLDKSKHMIHVVLSESEIPSKAFFDGGKLFEIRRGGTNQIVEFNFHEDGNSTSVNWFLTGKEIEGTLSRSQSPNPFPYSISANRIKGKIETHGESASSTHTPYEIAVTYTAALETAVVEPPPTAADAAAVAKSPSVKAYLELVSALRAGDKAKILASVPAERRASMDTPEFPKMLEFVQSMMPKDIKVLKVVEKDGTATLTMSGVLEGKPQKGEAVMKLDSGKWLMISESWEGK